jgi:IclR family pca regulon transcriptional regulator
VEERDRVLYEVRARGWSLTDEHLAHGIRSIAAPVRDGTNHVAAALNVTVHAAETSIEILTERYLPLLLQTAAAISADWVQWQCRPQITLGGRAANP